MKESIDQSDCAAQEGGPEGGCPAEKHRMELDVHTPLAILKCKYAFFSHAFNHQIYEKQCFTKLNTYNCKCYKLSSCFADWIKAEDIVQISVQLEWMT